MSRFLPSELQEADEHDQEGVAPAAEPDVVAVLRDLGQGLLDVSNRRGTLPDAGGRDRNDWGQLPGGEVLDGDEVRPHLSAGLGFSREARDINVTRIGWVARLLAAHDVVVLVPVIAPYAGARQTVRDDHAAAGVPYAEIFVSTTLEVAEQRDVKGLYAKARRGGLSGMTGVDDPYERPQTAELEIDTAAVGLGEATAAVLDLLREAGKTAA